MKCQHCDTQKDLIKNSITSKGTIQYLCRKCNTEKIRKYRKTNNGRKNIRKATYKSINKYRYKQNARVRVYDMIKKGKLLKSKKCTHCLKKRQVFAHHSNYFKPLKVIWLCCKCHYLVHKKLK